MSFPSSTDSFQGFTSTYTLQADNHAAQHNQEQAAIVAIENKVGTGASTPTATSVLVGNGTGTSAWGQIALSNMVSGILPTSNGGTGQSNLTNLPLNQPVINNGGSWAGSPSIVAPFLTGEPTITDFTNAQHGHTNASGGGTLNATTALQNSTVTTDKLNTGAGQATVTTQETTTSTSYVDLSTTTDTVTVVIGANGLALVAISAGLLNNTTFGTTYASFAISGASTVAAGPTTGEISAQEDGTYGNVVYQFGSTFLITGLTPGSTTFKMKYKVGSGTGGVSGRRIAVVPL